MLADVASDDRRASERLVFIRETQQSWRALATIDPTNSGLVAPQLHVGLAEPARSLGELRGRTEIGQGQPIEALEDFES